MHITKPFTIEKFGLILPDALIEVEEVVSRLSTNLYDPTDPEVQNKNGIVRCRVYTNETAFLQGLQPLDQFEKTVMIGDADRDVIHSAALNALYPVEPSE